MTRSPGEKRASISGIPSPSCWPTVRCGTCPSRGWRCIRVFRDGKAHSSYPVLTYGPELDALVKAMGECDDNSALLIGAASLGAYLLSQNYHLSDADLDQLFVFRIGDSLSRDWAMAVMQVATGQSGPKVSSGGAS